MQCQTKRSSDPVLARAQRARRASSRVRATGPSGVALALALLAPGTEAQDGPLRVTLRAGEKTHGPGEHDHPRFLEDWTTLLGERGCEVGGSLEFPTAEVLARTDVLVMYAAEGGAIHGDERARLTDYLGRGGGIVVLHDAVCGDDPHWFKTVVGGAWEHGHSKWLEGEIGLYFADREHPITRGVANFDLVDEIYWDLHLDPAAHVLASSFHTPFDVTPQMWVYEKDAYRAFVSPPGARARDLLAPDLADVGPAGDRLGGRTRRGRACDRGRAARAALSKGRTARTRGGRRGPRAAPGLRGRAGRRRAPDREPRLARLGRPGTHVGGPDPPAIPRRRSSPASRPTTRS